MTYALDSSLQKSLVQRAELHRVSGSSRDVIALRHIREMERQSRFGVVFSQRGRSSFSFHADLLSKSPGYS
jgi:hypothetical protein